MFNKEDSNSKNSSKSPSINMISQGTRVSGDIQSDNDLRIAGKVDGEATSKSRIILTSSGVVDGNIEAENADIAGTLNGEIFVTGKLVLRQSAKINGDINTKTLLVEEGAKINGKFNMSGDILKKAKLGQPSGNSSESSKNGLSKEVIKKQSA